MKIPEKRILIIEDEKSVSWALELKLALKGFESRIASNGERGLALLEKETFALILLDLVMPRVDGFTVLEKLKEKHITTPVIILTNLSQAQDEAHAKALGVKDYFVKTQTTIATIVERVAQVLEGPKHP